MRPTAALLLPIFLSLATSNTGAQELTLTVEYVIFDCMDRKDLYDQFRDRNNRGRENQHEVVRKLRAEAPVADSVKCVQLLTPGSTIVQASQAGPREIRVIATAHAPMDDGRYPIDVGMSCSFPRDSVGPTGASTSSRNLRLRPRDPWTPSSTSGERRDRAGNITGRYIAIWFVTLTEGRPDGGEGQDFLEIRPAVLPPARPMPRPKEAAQEVRIDGIPGIAG